MRVHQSDLLMRLIDDVAFLTARLAGLKALGLVDEALKDIDRLEQEAGLLGPEGSDLRARLEALRNEMRS